MLQVVQRANVLNTQIAIFLYVAIVYVVGVYQIMDPMELSNKLYKDITQRENRIINSKLYARCDNCGQCFKALSLTILEREQEHLISDSPNEFIIKLIMKAETIRLVCADCLQNMAT